MFKFSFLTAVHQNSTYGAAENVGTAAKPNGIMHEPVRTDRPNAFSKNSSSVLSCIQIAVDIPSQQQVHPHLSSRTTHLLGLGVKSTVIRLREGFRRKDHNSSASSSEGCGSSVKRSSSANAGHLGNATVPCTVMLKENGLDPMILALLQRSILDANREHRDSNPTVTDSNDVEDVLPNHISFSEELRLQGLGKWLQSCRLMLHHVAGTPERAWLLFILIFILETVVLAIF
ncbi:hypothetical protein BC332_34074 [Capsicum chinense]|nr:hypothetical protein BC332_34074 [Capsicum chinense]